jgi:DNA-directed RNA polymerase specialized sigma subunit
MKDDLYYRLDKHGQKIVEENMGFIIFKANQLYKQFNRVIELDDIVQICTIAFIRCLKYYDDSKYKIGTYTGKAMYLAVKREVEEGCGKHYYREFSIGEDEMSNTFIYVDNNCKISQCINRIFIENLYKRFKNKFSKNGQKILQMYLFEDKDNSEIARELNLSRQMASKTIIKFSNLCKNFISAKNIRDVI